MKRRLIIAILVMGMSYPVLADDQPLPNSQQLNSLRLADIMITTQLRHFKLWYAGRVKNWGLAKYELAQMRASLEEATRFYQVTRESNMTTMITQPADEVGSAIEAKDSARFAKAFDRLTAACNSCHEANGFGFIAIREPRVSPIETSPFSDESFSPK